MRSERLCSPQDIRAINLALHAGDAEGMPEKINAEQCVQMKIDLSKSLSIGDTPYGATASGTAGLKCLGLLCGGFPFADLREAGCISIYQEPAQLLAIFRAASYESMKSSLSSDFP
jgi:phosphoglycolate phosphatase-like HAD superfamily hydrolase